MKKEYLMIPGPTPIPHEITQAMGASIFNHRGPRFKDLLDEVTVGLKEIFCTQNRLYILTTSGTGAMEAGIVNFFAPGEKVISLSNGSFGDRMAAIARTYRLEVESINSAWGEPFNYDAIRERLNEDKEQQIKGILVVHNESSTAMMNDIERISLMRDGHPALLVVDAVSSLGAVPLLVDDWHVDICLTGSQKALMLPPGLAFISVGERAWSAMQNSANNCYYFDLKKAQNFLEKGQTPFTPAIPQIVALKEALKMLQGTDLQSNYDRHYRMMKAIRDAATVMGLALLVKDEAYASRTVTAIKKSPGIDIGRMRSLLRGKYGVEIAGGQGELANDVFRIGHLGAITEMDLIVTIAAMEMALFEIGYPVELGAGVKAAQQVIMKR